MLVPLFAGCSEDVLVHVNLVRGFHSVDSCVLLLLFSVCATTLFDDDMKYKKKASRAL